MQEMRESARIMYQCINSMPLGSVRTFDNKITPPKRSEIKDSMEAVIHHFKYYTENLKIPAGETYTPVESPKGEFGTYVVTNNEDKA